jgi:hypothetical protein
MKKKEAHLGLGMDRLEPGTRYLRGMERAVKEGRRSTIRRAVAGGRGQEEEGIRAAHLSNKTASQVDTDQTRDGNYPYDLASSRGATNQQHDKPNRPRRWTGARRTRSESKKLT